MIKRLTCPNRHQWGNTENEPALCPVCGAATEAPQRRRPLAAALWAVSVLAVLSLSAGGLWLARTLDQKRRAEALAGQAPRPQGEADKQPPRAQKNEEALKKALEHTRQNLLTERLLRV